MASFRSSPGEYLEECLSLLRDYKVPISEYDGGTRLKQTLMNFYADMMEVYESIALFLAGEVDISDCIVLFKIDYPSFFTFFSKPYRHHIACAASKDITNRCP